MAECFICFVSGTKEQLLDGISSEGIVKVCRKCSVDEGIPLIKRHDNFGFREPERRQSVHERLSRMAGINRNGEIPRDKELRKQETSLKEIIDKNFESKIKERQGFKSKEKIHDLVDNFHWIIMRVRRLKKISQEELAREIGESGSAIKNAEKGMLPEDYHKLIIKLENYFGIRLIKKEFVPKQEKPRSVVLDAELLGKPENIFEEEGAKSLTISDLKDMKEKHEEGIFEEGIKDDYMLNEDIGEDTQEFVRDDESEIDSGKKENPKEDLTKEEIDRILFGKK